MTDMANQESNQTRDPIVTKRADWIHIPHENILCIEHPAKINNVDKAVQTLGGLSQISKVLFLLHNISQET